MRRLTRARMRSAASRARASLKTRARHAALAVNPSAFSGQTGSPADFAAWVARGMGRRSSGFPVAWLARQDLPIADPARVGVVVHVGDRGEDDVDAEGAGRLGRRPGAALGEVEVSRRGYGHRRGAEDEVGEAHPRT